MVGEPGKQCVHLSGARVVSAHFIDRFHRIYDIAVTRLASSATRSGMRSIRMLSCDCVRAFTHGAQTVQRWDAERGCEIAVGAAAGGGFFKFDAQLARQLAGQCEQRAMAVRSIGGRLNPPAISSEQRLSTGLSARNLRSSDCASRRRGTRISISAELRLRSRSIWFLRRSRRD